MKKTNSTVAKTTNAKLAAATEQARIYLGLETLADRNADRLDFHEVSVASLREVIRRAFEAGAAIKAKRD